MVNLTFSFSNQSGDIPTYEFTELEVRSEYFSFISEQLELSDDKVFVCFPSYKGEGKDPGKDYELEHPEFYITRDPYSAEKYFEDFEDFNFDSALGHHKIHFNFFCFPNYEEAFEYCISLKEGL